MAVTARWYDESKTIMLSVYEERWTLDEYHQMITHALELNADIDHTVHRIVDFTNAAYAIPRNFLGGLRANTTKIPANLGCVVIVGASTLVESFTKIAQQLGYTGGSNIHFAESVADAVEIIETDCVYEGDLPDETENQLD